MSKWSVSQMQMYIWSIQQWKWPTWLSCGVGRNSIFLRPTDIKLLCLKYTCWFSEQTKWCLFFKTCWWSSWTWGWHGSIHIPSKSLNRLTGHFNSFRGNELSSLISYRQTNCETERSGSRIMNISTHKPFFWPGFSVQTGKVCLFQKFSICFLFLANPSFIGLFPALLAYRLITLFSAPCPFWEKQMQPWKPFLSL